MIKITFIESCVLRPWGRDFIKTIHYSISLINQPYELSTIYWNIHFTDEATEAEGSEKTL